MDKFNLDILNDADFEERKLLSKHKTDLVEIITSLRDSLLEAINMNERSDNILAELKLIRKECATKKSVEALETCYSSIASKIGNAGNSKDQLSQMSSLCSEVVKKDILPKIAKIESALVDCKIDTEKLGKLYSDVVKTTIVPSLSKLGAESERRDKGLVIRNIPDDKNPTNTSQLVIEKVPSFEGRKFTASRLGKFTPGRNRPILILPSGESSLKEDIKTLRNGIPKGSKIRLSFWLSPEERSAEAALFKAGIAAKQDEKLKISFFQVRGNRLRLVGADNKVAHRYVYDKVAGAVMGIPLVLDPEFDAAFPALA